MVLLVAGSRVVIADGRASSTFSRVAAGESLGTRFIAVPAESRIAARKHWIAYTLKTEGTLTVDDGARTALASGTRSLLPSGVRTIAGAFRRGSAVRCVDAKGVEFARGLSAYDADDARKIAGKKSVEIEPTLGYTFGDALVHKDDLVLL